MLQVVVLSFLNALNQQQKAISAIVVELKKSLFSFLKQALFVYLEHIGFKQLYFYTVEPFHTTTFSSTILTIMFLLDTPFTIGFVFWIFVSIITFWSLAYMISMMPKQHIKTDVFWIVLVSVALATMSVWISLWVSQTPNPNQFSYPPHLNPWAMDGFGGFPFTCFEYPRYCLGSGYPPTESWPRFFANYFCFLLLYFCPLFYTAKDYNLASLFNKKEHFTFFTWSLLINLAGLVYIALKFD